MRSPKGAFMTQLLIRLFIRRPNSPQDPRVRAAYGNLASVVGMVCNILLCLGKFVVGTLFGCLVIGLISNGLNLLHVSSYWQMVSKGVIILVAVILDVYSERIYDRMRNKE